MEKRKIIAYTDGGSFNNPGPSGIGGVFFDENKKELARFCEFIGDGTNNQAEYKAVIKALEIAKSEFQATEVEFFLDSELIVKQMNQEYKIKHPDLKPLFFKIREMILGFSLITFGHIKREKNKIADSLVKKAIKERKSFEITKS